MHVFADKLVLRTPALPYLSPQSENLFIKEAIFLASPSLYEICFDPKNISNSPKETQKTDISLLKYHQRMRSRCTPFGLFAACSVVKWGEKNEFLLPASHHQFERHTRLDMHYLCALAEHLAKRPDIKPFLLYFPNSSLYALADKVRYVEYKYMGKNRIHNLTSIDNSEYVEKVLQRVKGGAYMNEIMEVLIDDEITQEDAFGFVNELIDAQIFVHELEPSVTGDEFLIQIIRTLQKIHQKNQSPQIAQEIKLLQEIDQDIQQIDQNKENDIEVYRHVITKIEHFGVPYDIKTLFQTDLFKPASESVLDKKVQKELLKVIKLFNTIFNTRATSSQLKEFRDAFYERYEEQEIPLQEALDGEMGIGYPAKKATKGFSPLIGDVFVPGQPDDNVRINLNKWSSFLYEKVLEMHKSGEKVLTLKEKDILDAMKIENPKNQHWDDLGDTMNVKFSLVGGDAENLKIVFDGAFGTSATNILGRFAHGSPEIQAMIDEITAHDAEANPDAILAEIVHLPENRIGNILLRPVFRPYEIAYLAKSAVDEEHQISLDDLYISVKGQRIFLRSKRLNKIIIPRLSSAHNFSARSLPIYHFLCDLQSEGKRGGLMFSWGDVQNLFMTLPRVEMGNVILQAASWRLRKKEYEHLAKIPAHQLVAEMQKVCEKHHLPRFVALADGDNELLVDLENAQSIEMLISTVDKRNEIKLVEFLFDSESVPVCDEHQQAYTNEFVAVLKKEIPKREPKSTPTPPQKTQNPPQRYFALGSEWLYFKFYIGEKNADNLLTEVIKPLTENLLEENLISKWFFIRYSDPDFHIRFRVKIANTEAFNTIITQLYEAIAPWIEQRIVWKVQTDTYKRELERYGNTTIDIAEELFFHDSVALVNMLAMIEGDEGEIIRWKFGLRQVDELLDNFGFSLEQKLEFMKGLRDSFAREFNMERTLKKQLDDKYRKEKESIEAMLNRNLDAESEYLPLFETLYEKAERLKPVVNTLLEMQKNQELEVHLHSLLGSYIHMTLNRLNRSNPRLHELIMYDFLYRYYQSLFARKNKQKEPQLTQEEN